MVESPPPRGGRGPYTLDAPEDYDVLLQFMNEATRSRADQWRAAFGCKVVDEFARVERNVYVNDQGVYFRLVTSLGTVWNALMCSPDSSVHLNISLHRVVPNSGRGRMLYPYVTDRVSDMIGAVERTDRWRDEPTAENLDRCRTLQDLARIARAVEERRRAEDEVLEKAWKRVSDAVDHEFTTRP